MYDPAILQPGDVILVAGVHWDHGLAAGLLDWAIQWATVSPFHHAALVGDGVLLQSLATVQTAPLDTYAADGWPFTVVATPDERTRAVRWAEKHLGNPYGVSAILADGLMDLAHVVPPARWCHPQWVTCSGFVERAYSRGAARTLSWRPLPSPADLAASPRLTGARPRVTRKKVPS